MICCCFGQNNSCINGPFSDVKKAWDAAHNQIQLHGELSTIYNASLNTGSLQPTALCVPNPASYPFPSASSPQIARIIQSGVLRLAQPSPLNATNDPGDYNYLQRILFYFNQHYNSNITADFILFNTSEDCFSALKAGEVDVVGPNFSTGVFIDDVPRTELFQVACISFIDLVSIAVSPNLSVSTWSEFQTILLSSRNSTNSSIKIATLEEGDYLTAKGIFAGFEVIFFNSFSAYINSYDSGEVNVLWDVGTDDFGPTGLNLTSPAVFILSDVPAATSSYFNYDKC